jgi:hypothetical protein
MAPVMGADRMADGTRRRPRRLVEPVALLGTNVWDLLQAAMETNDAPASPTGETAAEVPANAPLSESARKRPSRRARRCAPAA